MKATFFAPDGQDISDISPEQMHHLFQVKSAGYWESGSGDASIRFPDKSASGELIFMVRPFGVFVQYTDGENDNEWVLSGGDELSASVEVMQNGTPWELPRTYFVDRELAEQVIVEFISTCQRPKLGTWVEF